MGSHLAGRRERERLWRGHLAAWRKSGLSQAAYCRDQNLKPAELSWWKYELARRDAKAGAAKAAGRSEPEAAGASGAGNTEFLAVRVAHSQAPASFEVLLRCGHTLRVVPGFDPAALRILVETLEQAGAGSC